MINQEQMDNNWVELMSIIDTHFEGKQKENILNITNIKQMIGDEKN